MDRIHLKECSSFIGKTGFRGVLKYYFCDKRNGGSAISYEFFLKFREIP